MAFAVWSVAIDAASWIETSTRLPRRSPSRSRAKIAISVPDAIKDNELVEFLPGYVVFQQGEESDFLYYLAEGVYSVVINGKHVDNLTPDDILIGEMSFLLEEERSATVVATRSASRSSARLGSGSRGRAA